MKETRTTAIMVLDHDHAARPYSSWASIRAFSASRPFLLRPARLRNTGKSNVPLVHHPRPTRLRRTRSRSDPQRSEAPRGSKAWSKRSRSRPKR
jgi:hypothetical protein